MSISMKTLKQLLAKSGNRCAFPGCKQLICDKEKGNAILGEICHIEAQSIGGPRFNTNLSAKEIDSESNLMILCPTHHKLVDDYPDNYTVEVLRKMKDEHERNNCEENSDQIDFIANKLIEIEQSLREVRERNYKIITDEQLDKKLNDNSLLGSFGINSFQIDDESFKASFSQKIQDEEIVVKCKNKEEGIYCIINELWRLKVNRQILIVYNEEGWEYLRKCSVKNKILIPFFHSDIITISGNTNIFVSANSFALSPNVIELRPRTYETITSSLIAAGMERSKAYDLVEKNHGLFALMRRYIIKGSHEEESKWVRNLPNEVIKTCLLLSQWNDEDGDKEVVTNLSGMPYDEFISLVIDSSKDEDPLVHVFNSYGKSYYCLANAEDAWAQFSISSIDPIWKTFFDLFVKMMSEKESLMTYDSVFKRTHAEMNGEKYKWSKTIRSGMVHSLIIKSYFLNDEPVFQNKVDETVSMILNSVRNETDWRFISHYLEDLTELSPDVVLSRLEKEFDDSTGLKSLFDNQSDNFLWRNHFYISVLRALEQMMLQRSFVTRAFEILVRINAFGFTYQGNSPAHTIRMVLCPWANFSAVKTPEEKRRFAELLFKHDKEYSWEILFSVLPENQQNVVGQLSKPQYRHCETITKVSSKDLATTRNDYFNLLVNNAFNNPTYWSKLLEYGAKLQSSEREVLFNRISVVLGKMTDTQKSSIKDEIRNLIYRNRLFNTSAWAMNEEDICEYEKLLESIVVNQKELDYCLYLSKSPYDIPLRHPVPHGNDDYINRNVYLAHEYIKKIITQFKEQCLSIDNLIVSSVKYENSYLGYYLGLYWDNTNIDFNVFISLINNQNTGEIACSYFETLGQKALPSFKKIIEIVNEKRCPKSCLVHLYKTEARLSDDTPSINDADDELKKEFWRKDVFGIKNSEWAIGECKKYGNASSFVELLYFANKNIHFSNNYLFEQICALKDLNNTDFSRMDSYYFSELLKPLQQAFLFDEKKRQIIIEIELKFFYLLDWNNMICTQYEVKHSPKVYTDILKLIYKKDEQTSQEENKESDGLSEVLFRLFDKMHFCPAEEGGSVDNILLRKWVDDFEKQLKENKQTRIRGMILGHLFAFSPAGKDGYSPCEAIREMIEKENDNAFFSEYHVTIFNNRGTYTGTSGREEKAIANRYKEIADYFAITHPKTASIYRGLAEDYFSQAKRERLHAENGF